jgi:hypothetical protein
MFGLNRGQLKNGLIVAFVIFLITQVSKELNDGRLEQDEVEAEDLAASLIRKGRIGSPREPKAVGGPRGDPSNAAIKKEREEFRKKREDLEREREVSLRFVGGNNYCKSVTAINQKQSKESLQKSLWYICCMWFCCSGK